MQPSPVILLQNFYSETPLIKLLIVDYETHNKPIRLSTLLADLDIQLSVEMVAIDKLRNVVNCNDTNSIGHILRKYDVAKLLLPTLDKLAITTVINVVLKNSRLGDAPRSISIINHTLPDNDIRHIVTCGFRLLSKGKFVDDNLDSAIQIGLHVTDLHFDEHATYDNFKHAFDICKNLTSVNFNYPRTPNQHAYYNIPTICHPLSTSLKIFNAHMKMVSRDTLTHCGNIEDLRITVVNDTLPGKCCMSVAPFAHSLKRVCISYRSAKRAPYYSCGKVDDALRDLKLCIKLEDIIIRCDDSVELEIHPSFAHSLRTLILDANRNMVNCKNVDTCTNLRSFHCNCKLVLESAVGGVVQFPNSLRDLSVSTASDAVSDVNLSNCTSIARLTICGINNITSCAQFGRTLLRLDASHIISSSTMQLNNIGLRNCISIISLDVSENPYITTCNPFAKSLSVLRCCGNSGISDKSLLRCGSIILLDSGRNNGVTNCGSFAHCIKFLKVDDSLTFDINSLAECTSIEYLSACRYRGMKMVRTGSFSALYATLRKVHVSHQSHMTTETYNECKKRGITLLYDDRNFASPEFSRLFVQLSNKYCSA